MTTYQHININVSTDQTFRVENRGETSDRVVAPKPPAEAGGDWLDEVTMLFGFARAQGYDVWLNGAHDEAGVGCAGAELVEQAVHSALFGLRAIRHDHAFCI